MDATASRFFPGFEKNCDAATFSSSSFVPGGNVPVQISSPRH